MKVGAVFLLALAVVNANFLQNVEEEISSGFENLQDGAREKLAELKNFLADDVEHVDDSVQEMKYGALKLIRSCAQNDRCRQLIQSAFDDLLDDVEEQKRVAVTGLWNKVFGKRAAHQHQHKHDHSVEHRKNADGSTSVITRTGTGTTSIGKRSTLSDHAMARAKACFASPTCRAKFQARLWRID